MADVKAKRRTDDEDGELGGYAPAVPGIQSPLVVAEGGHEGARAVYENRQMCEGRIAPQGTFVDYDGAITKSSGV